MTVKRTTYKGNPILQIWNGEGDKFPVVSFGVRKARAILEHVEDITGFVAAHTVDAQQASEQAAERAAGIA